jgi:hypothetical protein
MTDHKASPNYLVYQVGCIECGVSSYPIKTCATLDEAKSIATSHPSTWETEGGEGYVTVIDLHTCKTVA